MACTNTRKFASLLLACAMVPVIYGDVSSATERGYKIVAGRVKAKRIRVQRRVQNRQIRLKRHVKSHRHNRKRDYYPVIALIDEYVEPRSAPVEQRQRFEIKPHRRMSKIIVVSDKMKRLGEERAARRENRMLENLANISFRYYRPTEAYDVRFPSIVYLDILRK